MNDQQRQYMQQQLLSSQSSRLAMMKKIVNLPFSDKLLVTTIDLGIIVLLQVDNQTNVIERIALSETDLARGAVSVSAKPFNKILIPLDDPNNVISKSINERRPYIVEDWYFLFTPALTAEEARRNQSAASIECSIVYPLRNNTAAMIFSFYQPSNYVGELHKSFVRAYSRLVSDSLDAAGFSRR